MMIITRSNHASETIYEPSLVDVKGKFIYCPTMDEIVDNELSNEYVDYLVELQRAKDIEEFVEIWNRNTDDFEDGSMLKYYDDGINLKYYQR